METPATNTARPTVLVDLGKHRKSKVKKLRQGEGALMDEVSATIEKLRADGDIDRNAQTVVVVVTEKRDDKLLLGGLFK